MRERTTAFSSLSNPRATFPLNRFGFGRRGRGRCCGRRKRLVCLRVGTEVPFFLGAGVDGFATHMRSKKKPEALKSDAFQSTAAVCLLHPFGKRRVGIGVKGHPKSKCNHFLKKQVFALSGGAGRRRASIRYVPSPISTSAFSTIAARSRATCGRFDPRSGRR